MAAARGAKVVPNTLVLPSPLRKKHEKNDHKNRRTNDTGWLPATNCNCLLSFLSGLGLATLLVASIAIPLMVTISISKTKTSSSASTTIIATILNTTIPMSTSTTSTTTTTDIPCSTTCSSQQTCVKGVCVGIGYLSCTLTWSLVGDGDIVVTTPNNKTIYYNNTGPSVSTDQGELDKDDRNGTGPENVFWSNSSSVPPTGIYYTCFEPYYFSPNISSIHPISVTIKVLRLNHTTLTVTKNFTLAIKNYHQCGSISPTLLTSFTYP